MKGPPHPEADAIDRCWQCHRLCLQLLLELDSSSTNADRALLQALTDGFELSRVCAHALLRRSRLTPAICRLCAAAVRRVTETCRTTLEVHDGLNGCAAASNACARACEAVARRHVTATPDGAVQTDGERLRNCHRLP